MNIKKIIRESLEKVLKEHTVTFSKSDMAKLHKDGKITKKDDEGKDHDYIYNEEFELEKEKMTDPDDMRMYKEASLSKVYNAARKGSYPITLVAIEKGKVVDQKLVGTPEIVPAAFNDMQKEFPKAQINIEDRKGKILFKEGKLTENMSKGYAVVYRDKAYDKTYTAQIPPGISKSEIVKMLKKTIRVGLDIVSIQPLKEIEVDPDAEFKLDLKHLLKKHLIKKNESVNESKYVVIDPKGNASPIGSKIQGQQFIKGKKGYYIILAKNATKARRAIEKAGGKATSKKVQNVMYDLMYEAFIGPFVFSDSMSDDELKAMYQGALDGYANYSKGFQHPKSAYKKAYQAIEKILKKRGINEASDIWKIFDLKQKLYGQAMDIETDMKTIAMDIKQKRKDMEQEAEPGGGKVADRYGKELNKLEKNFNKKKKELKKVLDKLDKLDNEYVL